MAMNREECLKAAIECVCTNRNEQYGEPEDNFEVIAEFWRDYIDARYYSAVPLNSEDVALMMALFKIARLATGTAKDDSFVDACGYLACGCEITSKVMMSV